MSLLEDILALCAELPEDDPFALEPLRARFERAWMREPVEASTLEADLHAAFPDDPDAPYRVLRQVARAYAVERRPDGRWVVRLGLPLCVPALAAWRTALPEGVHRGFTRPLGEAGLEGAVSRVLHPAEDFHPPLALLPRLRGDAPLDWTPARKPLLEPAPAVVPLNLYLDRPDPRVLEAVRAAYSGLPQLGAPIRVLEPELLPDAATRALETAQRRRVERALELYPEAYPPHLDAPLKPGEEVVLAAMGEDKRLELPRGAYQATADLERVLAQVPPPGPKITS
ncbi:hypothetical protein [Marinithermus hydrothermalis]|uniref:Uncharacterized protein n=1 Tax=Marinithermus hydrothermalis (strain DSM 14884 / JCM 11576 / T1) TaxID=869210 RepID=F2NQW7_MARHT|nr:hypothetical protein [Marinithermus hydrothermalis]AEB12331.1 hypothetical protein Marky_1596 [Marinithermus hydrothermalis DSM 14884]